MFCKRLLQAKQHYFGTNFWKILPERNAVTLQQIGKFSKSWICLGDIVQKGVIFKRNTMFGGEYVRGIPVAKSFINIPRLSDVTSSSSSSSSSSAAAAAVWSVAKARGPKGPWTRGTRLPFFSRGLQMSDERKYVCSKF